ncbi:MAG: hypothetical protein IPK13_12725 [Deltaproteobacteria bacterium]|nr:hypothetical protein [Deltaproteobacteria bacterium]
MSQAVKQGSPSRRISSVGVGVGLSLFLGAAFGLGGLTLAGCLRIGLVEDRSSGDETKTDGMTQVDAGPNADTETKTDGGPYDADTDADIANDASMVDGGGDRDDASGADAERTPDAQALDVGTSADAADWTRNIPDLCAPIDWASIDETILHANPNQAAGLDAILDGAPEGATLLLEDGSYILSTPLTITTRGLIVRALSGNRERVILRGGAPNTPVLSILADNVAIASLTIRDSVDDAIQVGLGNVNESAHGTVFYDISVIDSRNADIRARAYSDGGLIACSSFLRTDDLRQRTGGSCASFYGLNLSGVRDWRVELNLLRGHNCGNLATGPSIGLQTGTRDIQVLRNVIVDPFQGIRSGLDSVSNPDRRIYFDTPCGDASNIDNVGGIIANNFVFSSHSDFDTGIAAWSSCDTLIAHNTIYSADHSRQLSSIEWRDPITDVTVSNNLTNFRLLERDGAQATVENNIDDMDANWVVDPLHGDLHLTEAAVDAIGGASLLPVTGCTVDIDGETRSDPADIGADER